MQAEQGPITGAAPLTPIQHWFLEHDPPAPHHFNQALLFAVQRPVAPDLLAQALDHLAAHHDALRLRFARRESGWEQQHAAPEQQADLLRQVDLSSLPVEEQQAALERVAAATQAGLDLGNGPLLRVVCFHMGAGQADRLLLVIHHLVVDGVSWRILLEDLLTAYEQLARRQQVQLPPKTTSWQYWAQRLNEHAHSEALRQESPYWLDEARRQVPPLPVDQVEGDSRAGTAETVVVTLGEEPTRALLQEVPAVYRTQVNDVLLTALAQAYVRWSGQGSLLVDLEGHGREELFDDVDLSRTVGWFTTLYPVLLHVPAGSGPGQALQAVKEQLRAVPQRGIGYGLLRYLSGDEELRQRLGELPGAGVCFNYLGQVDRGLPVGVGLTLAGESIGPSQSAQASRRHLLEVNGEVVGGRLRMAWTFSPGRHHRSTVEQLARGLVEALQELIAHCVDADPRGFTPADFPEATLDQDDLSRILDTINRYDTPEAL